MKAKITGQHELNPMLVGKTTAATTGILYAACVALVYAAPDFTMGMFANLFHGIDITKIASTPVPLGTTAVGFIEILIYSYIAGWLFARIYNYFLKKFG